MLRIRSFVDIIEEMRKILLYSWQEIMEGRVVGQLGQMMNNTRRKRWIVVRSVDRILNSSERKREKE